MMIRTTVAVTKWQPYAKDGRVSFYLQYDLADSLIPAICPLLLNLVFFPASAIHRFRIFPFTQNANHRSLTERRTYNRQILNRSNTPYI